jgi:hypothetical protein
MANSKRSSRFCIDEDESGCSPTGATINLKAGTLSRKLLRLLNAQVVEVTQNELNRFVEFVVHSVRHREVVLHLWTRLPESDIISLIVAARDIADLDEAVWRSFLAAHFGRPSASPKTTYQVQSAAMLLCGFGSTPKWTWKKVKQNRKLFRDWIHDHSDELQLLSFGNHRKYESKQPDNLWNVIDSFVEIANEYRGPNAIFAIEGEEEDRFDTLCSRLSGLHRFGRTGRFDFLVLLSDLGLIVAEPKSCYLRGATGPKKGAEQLWGKRGIRELERLAGEIAEKCDVSSVVVEDALCNWQK